MRDSFYERFGDISRKGEICFAKVLHMNRKRVTIIYLLHMIHNIVVEDCVREQRNFNETNFGGLALPNRSLISLYSEYRLKLGCQLYVQLISSSHPMSFPILDSMTVSKRLGNLSFSTLQIYRQVFPVKTCQLQNECIEYMQILNSVDDITS
jgi:hypothetical protein